MMVYLLSRMYHCKSFTPTRTIYLAIGSDEEVGGGNGAQHIAQYFTDTLGTCDVRTMTREASNSLVVERDWRSPVYYFLI